MSKHTNKGKQLKVERGQQEKRQISQLDFQFMLHQHELRLESLSKSLEHLTEEEAAPSEVIALAEIYHAYIIKDTAPKAAIKEEKEMIEKLEAEQ